MATPDTEVTEAALRSCSLTVQVSTKLNRSHLVHGATALILPSLGRTDQDLQNGAKQQVSVEDSMSMVHLSRGSLQPPGDQVRSEVAIVCELARAAARTGAPGAVGAVRGATTTAIRDAIAAVVPGCEDYNRRVRQPDGFQLPHPPRDSREFPTSTGKANFAVNPLRVGARARGPADPADAAQPRPVQHHDLRSRRPISRRQGRPAGRLRQPRRRRALRPRRGRARRPDLRIHRRRRKSRGAPRQGLPGGAVLDAGRQRRGLLSGDQFPRPAGPHCGRSRTRRFPRPS